MSKKSKNKSKSNYSYSNNNSYSSGWSSYGGSSSKKVGYDYGYGSKYGSYYDDESDGGYYSTGSGGSSWGSSWSWGSWGGGYDAFEDKDDDLYVKSSESYFTPKAADISRKLMGGTDTKDNRSLIKEMSRFFYHKMLEDKDYFDDKYKDETKLNENQQHALSLKKMFYEELWDKDVPGYSPLEKALMVFEQLRQKNGDKKQYSQEELAEDAAGMRFDQEHFEDPVFNELLDGNPFSKQRKMSILNKMFLIKNLGSEFKVEKEVEEKRVANSSIVAKKILRDYSELANVDLYQRLMPTFNLKLLTKELIVNVPIEKTEHKQKIIMLVDYSGSMNNTEKQEWVVALLVDRLRYVIKEEAEMYFSYFLYNEGHMNFTHIYNRASALAFWSSFSTNPNGGGTDLGNTVNLIKNWIESGKLHNLNVDLREERPEILAINDGQDSVGTDGFIYKTNAISLIDSDNAQLRNLCLKNKGKYVYVRTGGDVVTYDESGERKMKV